MKPLLLIGCGGHARSLIDLLESTAKWKLYGLVGLPEQVGSNVLGYPVLCRDSDLPLMHQVCPTALWRRPIIRFSLRVRLAKQLKEIGFVFPT